MLQPESKSLKVQLWRHFYKDGKKPSDHRQHKLYNNHICRPIAPNPTSVTYIRDRQPPYLSLSVLSFDVPQLSLFLCLLPLSPPLPSSILQLPVQKKLIMSLISSVFQSPWKERNEKTEKGAKNVWERDTEMEREKRGKTETKKERGSEGLR